MVLYMKGDMTLRTKFNRTDGTCLTGGCIWTRTSALTRCCPSALTQSRTRISAALPSHASPSGALQHVTLLMAQIKPTIGAMKHCPAGSPTERTSCDAAQVQERTLNTLRHLDPNLKDSTEALPSPILVSKCLRPQKAI